MKIERFEEIQAWQKARELVKAVYQSTNGGSFARDYSLKDQIRRASVSVMSNIAEGFARQTDKEFVQFLHVASGSAAEIQSQLYVARDLDYVSDEEFGRISGLAGETARLIMGFIKYLKGAKR
ncbi:MAG: four helix bundle protein [Dehalococcoidia bacterium]|nr:four helix bundle protein [Dehalococcoidia bacterium]